VSDYDPADHTVEEVKAYVEEHPDELEAVHEAEVEGKNRVTLIEWLESPEINNDLPGEQPPRGSGSNRGRDEEARANAPGQQKRDAADDPTVIDESPADEEGAHVEHHRDDPNTYPDPENLPHTP
jgi:hypothetical protein